MPAVTSASDGFQLARALGQAANDINNYLNDNWDGLTKMQRTELEIRHFDLLMLSGTIRDLAVGKLLAEAQLTVAELTRLTERARKQLKSFDDARKAIRVATALFGLASAIAQAVAMPSGNTLKAAHKALKELLEAA